MDNSIQTQVGKSPFNAGMQSQTNFAVPHFAAHAIAHLLCQRSAFGAAAIMSAPARLECRDNSDIFFATHWRRFKFLLKDNDLKRMIQVQNDDTDNGEQEPSKEVMKEQGLFQ